MNPVKTLVMEIVSDLQYYCKKVFPQYFSLTRTLRFWSKSYLISYLQIIYTTLESIKQINFKSCLRFFQIFNVLEAFSLFFVQYAPYLLPFSALGNNNLVHWFKNSLGHLVFSETWGDIELFCIPWIHQENVKSMQIINYKIYVDLCYYTVHKFSH